MASQFEHAKEEIYGRIVIIVLIPMLLLTCLLLGVYQVFYGMSLEQAKENFTLQTQQYTNSFERRFENIAALAQNVGYSEGVQKYFAQMTSQERVSSYKTVRQFFSTVSKTVPGVQAIYVGNNDGVFIESGNGNLRYFQANILNRDLWAGERKQAGFTDMFRTENSEAPRHCIYYAPIGIITPISLMNEADVLTCGVLIDVGQLFHDASPASQAIAEVLLYQGQVIASSAELSTEQTQALVAGLGQQGVSGQQAGDDATIRIGQDDYLIGMETLSSGNGLTLGCIAPVSVMMREINNLSVFMWVCMAGCLVLVALLMSLLRQSIVKPIKTMVQDMCMITSKRTTIHASNVAELNLLANGINDMLQKLTQSQEQEMRNMERIHELEYNKMEAEMFAYRSQMNPHFLFNTLNSMVGMSVHYRIEPLEQLSTALSECMQYALRAPDRVVLEQELQHLDSYMRILQIRMPDKYRLLQQVEEEALGCSVLSLMLQPLVENALQHGFHGYQKQVPCTISVQAWIDRACGMLHVRVTDNGKGITKEKLSVVLARMEMQGPLEDREHIALINISRRLRIAYAGRSSLRITTRVGCFTCVEIQIPVERMASLR